MVSPTADIRVAAADAYLGALTTYTAGTAPANRVCITAATTSALRACWQARLAVQHTFDTDVAAITFPADMATDVRTLSYVTVRLVAAMSAILRSPDPARDLSDLGIYSSASVDFLQVSSNLREELGIIATPSAG